MIESFIDQHKEFLETLAIILAITAPVTGGILTYFRKKFNCIPQLKEDIETEKERSLRQSKALIIISYRLDDINKEQHNRSLNLGPEVETILKDEYGKL